MDAVQTAVATYAPERLEFFLKFTGSPLVYRSGIVSWTDEMRATLFLGVWTGYDVARPN